jgi:UDP-glucose 4-epimerase
MKLVVTGGAGFIGGAYLQRLLTRSTGVELICLSSSDAGQEKLRVRWPDLEVYPLRSLEDRSVQERIGGADALFHFGWSTVPRTAQADPAKDLQENVLHALPLVRHAASLGVGRFIFLSSGGTVYGEGRGRPHRESDPVQPVGAYGIAKLSFENYLRNLCGAMRPVILRPGNIYGRGSDPLRPQGVIEHWMHTLRQGRPLQLWGDTSVVRDYVHVNDLLDVLEATLTYEGAEQVINVGTGVGTSLDGLIRMLGELTGADPERVHKEPERALGPLENVLDPSLCERELGVIPRMSIRDGLAELWARFNSPPARRG